MRTGVPSAWGYHDEVHGTTDYSVNGPLDRQLVLFLRQQYSTRATNLQQRCWGKRIRGMTFGSSRWPSPQSSPLPSGKWPCRPPQGHLTRGGVLLSRAAKVNREREGTQTRGVGNIIPRTITITPARSTTAETLRRAHMPSRYLGIWLPSRLPISDTWHGRKTVSVSIEDHAWSKGDDDRLLGERESQVCSKHRCCLAHAS